MNFLVSWLLLFHCLWSLASAFVVPSPSLAAAPTSLSRRRVTTTTTVTTPNNIVVLFAADKNKKKKGGLDESVRTKLVSESIAPWRTLRLFLYGAAGSGAFIGGLVTLTGTAAILSGAKEGDLNTEVRTFGKSSSRTIIVRSCGHMAHNFWSSFSS
jgi:Low psii accumulation1 / Rep27